MFSPLVAAVGLSLSGKGLAAQFQEVTGLSRTTFQSPSLGATLQRRSEQVSRHKQEWLASTLRTRGAGEDEARQMAAEVPDGPLAALAYALGDLEAGCSGAHAQLVQQLDSLEGIVMDGLKRGDSKGVGEALTQALDIHPAMRIPINASGVPRLARLSALSELPDWVLQVRARALLLFLASSDLEYEGWIARSGHASSWAGQSRFGALIAPPDDRALLRRRPNDPVPRLIDLVGSFGDRLRSKRWLNRRPTSSDMGDRAEASRAIAGDGRRWIEHLRAGDTTLTGINFGLLVESQLRLPGQTWSRDASDLLVPMLVAAWTLTHLMPADTNARRHLDRRGWREAYLTYWSSLAEARGLGASPQSPGLPRWLTSP